MIVMPYMVPQGPQKHITEDYVATPPALHITDEQGAVWTLGISGLNDAPRGEYAFAVLRNGVCAGEAARRIERRGGRIRAFTREGWKRWTGTSFV